MTDVTKRPWIGTSWKMNKTRAEAVAYLSGLLEWSHAATVDAAVIVFPAFTALADAGAVLRGATFAASGPTVQLGAQNMHWQLGGAHTGEISPAMLLDCGASVVELGHFERRRHFGETDEYVNLKARAALAAGLEPVLCVGDSKDDRRYGVASEVVARQVKIALHEIDPDALAKVVIAYEPGWAIGAGGEEAQPVEVEAMHSVIRAAVSESHGPLASRSVRVVYGGSVQADNADSYGEKAGVDGLFVGRAALTLLGFIAVIEQFCTARDDRAGLVSVPEGTTS